jgi:predicted kinase
VTAAVPSPGGGAEPRDLVLLCGLAFSGKSTLAEAIVQQLGGSIVSLDEINARRGLCSGEGIPREEWSRTHRTAVTAIEERMRRGISPIVVDDTHCFRLALQEFEWAMASG